MHKTLIFSFIITAGLLLSASLTTNAETTAATTETTTSTGSIFNEANIQKDKGYISNA